MGALKSFEDIWLMGRRTRREVGIVAREILCLEDSERRPITTDLLEAATYDMIDSFEPQTSSDFGSFFDNLSYGRNVETTGVFV
jgi:hypothetical protein